MGGSGWRDAEPDADGGCGLRIRMQNRSSAPHRGSRKAQSGASDDSCRIATVCYHPTRKARGDRGTVRNLRVGSLPVGRRGVAVATEQSPTDSAPVKADRPSHAPVLGASPPWIRTAPEHRVRRGNLVELDWPWRHGLGGSRPRQGVPGWPHLGPCRAAHEKRTLEGGWVGHIEVVAFITSVLLSRQETCSSRRRRGRSARGGGLGDHA